MEMIFIGDPQILTPRLNICGRGSLNFALFYIIGILKHSNYFMKCCILVFKVWALESKCVFPMICKMEIIRMTLS